MGGLFGLFTGRRKDRSKNFTKRSNDHLVPPLHPSCRYWLTLERPNKKEVKEYGATAPYFYFFIVTNVTIGLCRVNPEETKLKSVKRMQRCHAAFLTLDRVLKIGCCGFISSWCTFFDLRMSLRDIQVV